MKALTLVAEVVSIIMIALLTVTLLMADAHAQNARVKVSGKAPAIHGGVFYGENYKTFLYLRLTYPGRYIPLDADEYDMRIRVADFRDWDDEANCTYFEDDETLNGVRAECDVTELVPEFWVNGCYKVRVIVEGGARVLNNLTNNLDVCYFR